MAVNKHADRLFGYCLKHIGNQEDSNDIVQDVFEKLWNNRRKIDFEKSKAWMYTCAHNALINFVKKQNRITYLSEYNSYSQKKYDHHGKQFEIKEVLDLALNTLPSVQKSIILLRDLEGYNYEEIGEILKLTESQVKVYLFRARNKIKKQIKDLTVLEIMHA